MTDSEKPDAPEEQFGAAPHSDYGFLTVLTQDALGGLDVRTKDGRWVPAEPRDDMFVLNVGDMLERWTDGRWPSAAHRVKNRAARSRFSIPYFYDPHLSTVIGRLPSLASRTTRKPIVYRDYLLDRLNRNYQYRHGE